MSHGKAIEENDPFSHEWFGFLGFPSGATPIPPQLVIDLEFKLRLPKRSEEDGYLLNLCDKYMRDVWLNTSRVPDRWLESAGIKLG